MSRGNGHGATSTIIPVTNDRADVRSIVNRISMAEGKSTILGPRAPFVSPEQRWSFALTNKGRYDPSQLVQDQSWDVYAAMERDPWVWACFSFLQDVMLSANLEVVPSTSDSAEAERVEAMKANLDAINGSKEQALEKVLRALAEGVSIVDTCPERVPEGEEHAGMVFMRQWNDCDPRNFDFDQDEYGRLKPDGLVQFPTSTTYRLRHDIRNFIIYSHEARYGNLWGCPMLDRAYMAFFSREVGHRSLNVFMEKYNGVLVAKHPKDWTEEDVRALLDHLRDMHGGAEYAVENGVDIDLTFPAAQGLAAWIQWLERYDTEIAVAFRVPILLLALGKHGSYGQADVQLQGLQMTCRRWHNTIGEVIRDQWGRNFCRINYGGGPVPKIQFGDVEVETMVKRAEFYQKLLGLGLNLKRVILAGKMGIREEDLDQPMPAPAPPGTPAVDGEDPKPADKGRPGAKPKPTADDEDDEYAIAAADGAPMGPPKPRRDPNTIEQRMALAEMIDAENAAVQNGSDAIARVIAGLEEDLVGELVGASTGPPLASRPLTGSSGNGPR